MEQEKQHKYVIMYFSNINRQSKGPKTYFSQNRSIEKAKQSNFMNWTLQIRYNLARLAPKNHDFADYMIKEISTPRSTIDFH